MADTEKENKTPEKIKTEKDKDEAVLTKKQLAAFQKELMKEVEKGLKAVLNKKIKVDNHHLYKIVFLTSTDNYYEKVKSNHFPVKEDVIFFVNTFFVDEPYKEDADDHKDLLIEIGLFTKKQIDHFTEETRTQDIHELKELPFRIIEVRKSYDLNFDERNEAGRLEMEETITVKLDFLPDYYNSLTSKILTEKKR